MILNEGGCDDTLAALRSGRVEKLLHPDQSNRKQQKLDEHQLDSYDYDLIVVGGGSGGLACSKVCSFFVLCLICVCVFFFVRKLEHLIKKFAS